MVYGMASMEEVSCTAPESANPIPLGGIGGRSPLLAFVFEAVWPRRRGPNGATFGRRHWGPGWGLLGATRWCLDPRPLGGAGVPGKLLVPKLILS